MFAAFALALAPVEARDTTLKPTLTELRSFDDWKHAFDAARIHPRLVLLVSPT